jgi:hypothetical protein
MNIHKITFAAALAFAVPISGCVTHEIRERTVVEADRGDYFEPEGGYRDRVEYYYYPDVEVYYDRRNSRYHWHDDSGWHYGHNVPSTYYLRDHVNVYLEGDRPDRYHDRVYRRYPHDYWRGSDRYDPHGVRRDVERHDRERADYNRRTDTYKNRRGVYFRGPTNRDGSRGNDYDQDRYRSSSGSPAISTERDVNIRDRSDGGSIHRSSTDRGSVGRGSSGRSSGGRGEGPSSHGGGARGAGAD